MRRTHPQFARRPLRSSTFLGGALLAAYTYVAGVFLHWRLTRAGLFDLRDTCESLATFLAVASLALAGLTFARHIDRRDYWYAHWFLAGGLAFASLFGSALLAMLFSFTAPVNLCVLLAFVGALAYSSATVAIDIERRESSYPRLLRSPHYFEHVLSTWFNHSRSAQTLTILAIVATAVAFTLTGLTTAEFLGGHPWLYVLAPLTSILAAPVLLLWSLFVISAGRYHMHAVQSAMARQRGPARPKTAPMTDAQRNQRAKHRARKRKLWPHDPEEPARRKSA